MSIIDSSPKPKTVTLNNGAAISSLRSRFGGASLYLNSGGYASVADNTDFGFGTGDFTIELWVYAYDNNNWKTLFEVGTYQSGLLWRMGTSAENLYINNSQYNWNPGNVPLNTWSHLALVRNNGTVKVFINGTESLSVSNSSDLGASKPLFIGSRVNGSETFSGFMDEIRITKGIGAAKYTSNFDIKTLYAPFPSTGTPITPPEVPTDLIAGANNARINMIWTAPLEDNGGIIENYAVQYKTQNETEWRPFVHDPSVVTAISVTGLVNGTTYSVRVGAINLAGTGVYAIADDIIPTPPLIDLNPDPYWYNTSLLLHFDGDHNDTTTNDASIYTKTATTQGDAKISIAKNKFGGSSMYFDGSGDYITIPNHPGFDFYGEDFTIEYWEYRIGTGTSPVMCRVRTGQGYTPWLLGHNESGTLKLYMSANYGNWAVSSLSMGSRILETWTHYAVVRQGNTVRTYQNGVQIATASFTSTLPTGDGVLSIGRYADNSTDYFHGYLDDIRITRGVCRYPDGTTFSVPSLPFSEVVPTINVPTAPTNVTAAGSDAKADLSWTKSVDEITFPVSYEISYSEDVEPKAWTIHQPSTKLLLHFNKGDVRGNATVVDYSSYGRNILWNPSSPAKIDGSDGSTAYQKFGDGCLDIPYSRGGYTSPYIIKIDESNDLNPGTGDYTLEMFLLSEWSWSAVRSYTNGGVGRLFGSYNGASGTYWAFWAGFGGNNSTGRIAKFVNGSSAYHVDVSNDLNASTDDYIRYSGGSGYNSSLKHLVFCRHNGTMRIFLNGSKILETADSNDDNFANGGLVVMGGESGNHYPNNYIYGRLDELKYTVGEALYTGNSIDLLPASEFNSVSIKPLTNDKNYVFRMRGQNSSGYGDYSTSNSVLVAPPPDIIITSQPQNDRVIQTNENTTFSVVANVEDNSSLTYQWQAYSTTENNSNRSWVNIDGANNSSLTINSDFFAQWCCSEIGMDSVRCLLTSSYGSKLTDVARLVSVGYNLGSFGVYPDYSYNTSGQSVNGIFYQGYYSDANQRLLLYMNNYSYYGGSMLDSSWYTGNDTRLKFQYSLDASNWSDVDSAYNIEFRFTDYNTYQNKETPAIDLSGRVYFRSVLEDLWPYTTNNGTTSTTENSTYTNINNYWYIDYTATAPTLPTNFSAIAGDKLVALSWTKGVSGGLPDSTTYSIEYSTDQSNWTTISLPFANSNTYVTSLDNGTTYYFRMKVVNSVGSTEYTSTLSATPNVSEATVPSIINNLTASAGDSRAYLTWDSPTDDGRSLPISYNIRYSTDGGNNWIDYQEVPPSPPNFTINQTSVSGVQLNWSNELVLPAITGYLVQYSNDGGSNWTTHIETPPTFNPSSISGLQLWLDSSDASTLYDATTGGSLVAADGSVARWEDKSGNARHATQGTSANRPLRKTAIQGGKDVLRFDGSDDHLTSTDFLDLSSGQAITAFVVCKRSATGAYHALLSNFDRTTSGAGGANTQDGWSFRFTDTGKLDAAFEKDESQSLVISSNSVDASTFSVVAFKATAGSLNTTSTLFRNGAALSSSSSGSVNTLDDTTYPVKIGAESYFGSAISQYNGDIAEIIIYDSALSDTDRQSIENYLISKWGIV